MEIKMTDDFRIMFRREGSWWVAFYGQPAEAKKFKPPIELSRVRMNLADQDAEIKMAFIEFNKKIMEVSVRNSTGTEITLWEDPKPGPESER
jgi:hypothetical protein